MRVEKVLDDGVYDARLVDVEQKETKYGKGLMWTFEVLRENTQVVGFTSMSPSTRAKAYCWARALAGKIDPELGWGPEDVVGGECAVALEIAEDAQGVEKNKVVAVKPPRSGKTAVADPEKSFGLFSS